MAIEVGPLHPAHWPAVRDIYEAGIATGNATFETSAPDWATWDSAGRALGRIAHPR